MAEWFKARAWKARVANHYRGFESPSLRQLWLQQLPQICCNSSARVLNKLLRTLSLFWLCCWTTCANGADTNGLRHRVTVVALPPQDLSKDPDSAHWRYSIPEFLDSQLKEASARQATLYSRSNSPSGDLCRSWVGAGTPLSGACSTSSRPARRSSSIRESCHQRPSGLRGGPLYVGCSLLQ